MARKAIGIDLRAIGDKELARDFARLPANVQRKIFGKALRPAGKLVHRRMRELVPVDTGNLRKSLKLRAMKRSRDVKGIHVPLPTRAELGIDAEGDSYYPTAVEFGHVRRDGSKAPPQSYIRRAESEKRAAALALFNRGLRSLIDEVMKAA